MFVLDTNVVSELRKVRSGRADRGVATWAGAVPAGQLFISVITIHELEDGVLLAEHSDLEAGAVLRRWLDDSVMQAFSHRTIGVDAAVARRAASLHVPDPAPFRDALIGATALEHGMAVVTRNTNDFVRFTGLEVINPWTRSDDLWV